MEIFANKKVVCMKGGLFLYQPKEGECGPSRRVVQFNIEASLAEEHNLCV